MREDQTPNQDWFDSNAPTSSAGPAASAPGPSGAGTGAPIGPLAPGYTYDPNTGLITYNGFNPATGQGATIPGTPPVTDPHQLVTGAPSSSGFSYTGNAQQDMGALLAQGMDPQQAIDQINSHYNLQTGSSYAWRSIPGAPGGGVVEVPGGSYYAPGSNGQWGWNAGDSAGGGSNPASNNVTPFSYQPFTESFSYQPFQAPTGVTEQNDPGYEARLQMGTDALQHSAAAKGQTLSGQTLSDIDQYAQAFASNEYQNVYSRAAQTYATNYSNALNQYQQDFSKYQTGWQNAFNSWGANANLSQQNWQNAFNLANQQFGMNQTNWQNQYNTAALGLNAANMAANAGSNYANSASNLITGSGNAQAAGQVGSANAWNGAFGNLANYGMQYPYLQQNPSIYGSPYGNGGPGVPYNYGTGG